MSDPESGLLRAIGTRWGEILKNPTRAPDEQFNLQENPETCSVTPEEPLRILEDRMNPERSEALGKLPKESFIIHEHPIGAPSQLQTSPKQTWVKLWEDFKRMAGNGKALTSLRIG